MMFSSLHLKLKASVAEKFAKYIRSRQGGKQKNDAKYDDAANREETGINSCMVFVCK